MAKYKKRYNKEHYQKHKSMSRKSRLKCQYGITIEDYDNLFAKQDGLCAICGKMETYKHYKGTICRLSIDHNHTTGAVRGLLCQKCNAALGFLDEDIIRMLKMIEYIEND